ncbi:TadE/TadG family type IV pilus assembly protein [Bradyrhizobium sp. CCBAU 11386]|uniref:TadE/TadG family type IV pilus assembly protein n=1 Tax=Bradyrhizobium sp. CCBAU 11386 TaxID=1630837 RepID=UPI0023049A20|nr:TadE/TadG family type IV pilus assembly protein [Bradyrhizobium sp. CCBAU 11386]
MKSASSRGLDRSGAVAFELVLVFMTFFTIFLAVCDLARFWVTTNSVRTLASELVRQTLIYCADQDQTTTCALPSTGTHSIATAEATVPFLFTSGFAATPSASRSPINTTTGAMGITASASYNFSFMLPVWRGMITQVSQSTQLGY